MAAIKLYQATPVLHVGNLADAVVFFRDRLGFIARSNYGGYAYLERDGAAVRVMDETIYGPPPAGTRRYMVYIDLAGVDALWAELRDGLAGLPEGTVHPPANQPYGKREFSVLGPDGNYVVFGETIFQL